MKTNHTKDEQSEVRGIEELKNKLVKHWWSDCLDPNSGELLLNEIDGSSDFSSIPTNSYGRVELEIGELGSIVDEVVKQTLNHLQELHEREKRELVERMKEENTKYHLAHFDRTTSHSSGMAVGFSDAVRALQAVIAARHGLSTKEN